MTKFGRFLLILIVLAGVGGAAAWYFSSNGAQVLDEAPPSLKIGSATFKGSIENVYYTFGGDHNEGFQDVKEAFEDDDKQPITLRENLDYVYLDNEAFEVLGQNPANGMTVKQIINCVSEDANKFLFIQYKNRKWNVYPKGPFGDQTEIIADIEAYKVYPGEAFVTVAGDSAQAFCMKKSNTKPNVRVSSLVEGWNLVAVNEDTLSAFLNSFPSARNTWYLEYLNDTATFTKYFGGDARLSNYVIWVKSVAGGGNQGGANQIAGEEDRFRIAYVEAFCDSYEGDFFYEDGSPKPGAVEIYKRVLGAGGFDLSGVEDGEDLSNFLETFIVAHPDILNEQMTTAMTACAPELEAEIDALGDDGAGPVEAVSGRGRENPHN